MWKHKVACVGAIAALVTGLFAVQSFSQEAAPARQGRQREARGGRRFDPDRMRQTYLGRIKEALKATDEEWNILGPRVEKVQSLSGQLAGRGRMGMMFGRGGDRAGRPETAEPVRELTDVEKSLQDLRATAENEGATPDELGAKLKALREAREKVKQELAKEQDALRQLVTLRQEAQLVLMGLLD